MLLAKYLQIVPSETGCSPVGARSDQQGRYLDDILLSDFQLLQPEFDAPQRIVMTTGVKEHKRKVSIVKKQCMNEPIIILPSEIPQDGLALRAVASLLAKLIQYPELLAMRRRVLFELLVRQPPAESGLANTRVTHQHDLSSGICDRWRGGLFEKTRKIKFVNLNAVRVANGYKR